MVAAVLNAINIRLDSKTVSLFFTHANARLIIVDYQFLPLVQQALEHANRRLKEDSRNEAAFAPQIVVVEPEEGEEVAEEWREFRAQSRMSGATFYEDLLREGDEDFPWQPPESEEDAISLNYTSGTTSAPKVGQLAAPLKSKPMPSPSVSSPFPLRVWCTPTAVRTSPVSPTL